MISDQSQNGWKVDGGQCLLESTRSASQHLHGWHSRPSKILCVIKTKAMCGLRNKLIRHAIQISNQSVETTWLWFHRYWLIPEFVWIPRVHLPPRNDRPDKKKRQNNVPFNDLQLHFSVIPNFFGAQGLRENADTKGRAKKQKKTPAAPWKDYH